MFCNICFDLIDLVPWFINLGDCYDDRHSSSFCVADGFYGLRHHTIVGGNYDDGDIGKFGSSGSQTRK